MQIEYATAFISCKRLLLYDEPLRETPITQNLLCMYWKKTYRKYSFFFYGILETLGQDHDSILALLL